MSRQAGTWASRQARRQAGRQVRKQARRQAYKQTRRQATPLINKKPLNFFIAPLLFMARIP